MAKTVRVVRKRSSLKRRRALIGKKSKVVKRSGSRRRVKLMKGGGPKNILLIIDPQNDFTPAYEGGPNPDGGSLKVPGAIEDYYKIIQLVKSGSYDEIHISLDTHQELHIGNPGFWNVVNERGGIISGAVPTPFSTLKLTDDGKIEGTPLMGGDKSYYIPKNTDLTGYVNAYLKFYAESGYDDVPNKHNVSAWIWANHCLENTEGHKIYKPLQDALDSVKDKVTYHIKGQNRLTEMFSIFSAEIPVNTVIDKMNNASDDEKEYIRRHQYAGEKTESTGKSAGSYDKVIELLNLDTSLNTEFIKQLIGEPENPNTLHVCGEAKTHCVKSSLVDLLENCGLSDEQKTSNIILIEDASSPIGGEDAGSAAIALLTEKKCGIKKFDEVYSKSA